jgi:hypothetical protein
MKSEQEAARTGVEMIMAAIGEGRPFFCVYAILNKDAHASQSSSGPGMNRGTLLIAPGVPLQSLALLVGATLAKACEAPEIVARTLPAPAGRAFMEMVERVLDACPDEVCGQTSGHMLMTEKPREA